MYRGCFKKFDIIWDVQHVSEKFISSHNQITWSILIQIISNFNSMCRNDSKFDV